MITIITSVKNHHCDTYSELSHDLLHSNLENHEDRGGTLGRGKCTKCDCLSFVDWPGNWPECKRCGHDFEAHW